MALRKILTEGDPTLYKKSRPVERFDERLHILLDDMKETLADANGAGLAAHQVGIGAADGAVGDLDFDIAGAHGEVGHLQRLNHAAIRLVLGLHIADFDGTDGFLHRNSPPYRVVVKPPSTLMVQPLM